MMLHVFVLVREGSDTPLDSSKGLSEQGVLPNTILQMVHKRELAKPKPVVKRVITMIYKGRNESREYEYDDSKTLDEYWRLFWNDIDVEAKPLLFKVYVVVIEGTKQPLELTVPLKDMKMADTIKLQVVKKTSLSTPNDHPSTLGSAQSAPVHNESFATQILSLKQIILLIL